MTIITSCFLCLFSANLDSCFDMQMVVVSIYIFSAAVNVIFINHHGSHNELCQCVLTLFHNLKMGV